MAGHNLVEIADQHFFYEDEIFRINKKGRVSFGMVMENYEASSSDQDSDNGIPSITPIAKGELRVAWHPTGREEVIKDSTVGLADRSLMPGDVVRRMIPGKDTQRGYCRDINVRAAVKVNGTHFVIPQVSSDRLKPLEQFTPDLAVCLDSWVGSTRVVNSKMVLESEDGSKLVWKDLDSCPFEDYQQSKGKFDNAIGSLFYPGQTVVSTLGALDSAEWINISKDMVLLRKHKSKEHRFVVLSIDIESVVVHWQCRALSHENEGGHEGTHIQPKSLIEGDDLKRLQLLNRFEPCTLQVSDRNYLTVTESDLILQAKEWRKQQSREYRALLKSCLGNSLLNDNIELPQKKDSKTSDVSTNTESKLKLQLLKHSKEAIANSNVANSEEREEDWQSDSSSGSTTTHSSCKSSDSSRTVYSKPPVLVTKLLKGKKLKRTRRNFVNTMPSAPKPGDKIVVETLSTHSTANVVWQDGQVECNIPSTDLYPIHHLDDQEFFPGDFVVSGAEGAEPPSLRDYGVVQSMNHQGRTAVVKWFRTYTSSDEPRPALIAENEVSVYDLKDHPDFQYRPATVVIRVANFVGEDSACTAGQVIDNFPEGKVRVWWVDGHSSMCWPQDLFKIGEYDSDDGDFWADNSSENDSWETQSIESVDPVSPGAPPELKPKLAANVERARRAMARLEEIFTQNPSLQSHEVMRKLLDVYKECRYLDRLMETSFFHEDHFQGLLERVRERGSTSAAQQIQDHMSRLFNQDPVVTPMSKLNSSIRESEDVLKTTDLGSEPKGCSTPEIKVKESRSNMSLDTSKSNSKLASNKENNFYPTKKIKLISRSNSTIVANVVQNQLINKGAQLEQKQPKSCTMENQNGTLTGGKQIDCANLKPDKQMEGSNQIEKPSEHLTRKLTNITLSGVKPPVDLEIIPKSDSLKQEHLIENQIPEQSVDCHAVTSKSNTDVTKNECIAEDKTVHNKSNESQRNYSYEIDNKHHDSGIFSESTKASEESNESYPSSTEYLLNDVVGLLAKQAQNVEHELQEKKISSPTVTVPHASNQVDAGQHICVRVCSLIKAQLVLAHGEIIRRYGITTPSVTEIASNNSDDMPDNEKSVSDGPNASTSGTSELHEQDEAEGFSIMDAAPSTHNYYLTMLQPIEPQNFFRTVRKELKLLKGGLPPGVWVKTYEDRMDLFSALIRGPNNTPYEDGMFLFDFQLPNDYPTSPPFCHYISYCSDRLNPNLYEDGKVCVSLLGTWSGRGTEMWCSSSSLLQVLVSIQGLILVSEPYFNEAGYDKQKGSQSGCENSRMYNEMVVLKLVQATTKLLRNPPEIFKEEIVSHFKLRGHSLAKRLENWMMLSESHHQLHPTSPMTPVTYRQNAPFDAIIPPDFPLIPASKGFCLSLKSALEAFNEIINGLCPPST